MLRSLILTLLFISQASLAQELSLITDNVQVYARVKNCVDFYLCSPYEETLKIDNGIFHWKAEFKNSLLELQEAFNNCSVGNLKFDITIRDENGIARKDFLIPKTKFTQEQQGHLLPMELHDRTYKGLALKANPIEMLLRSDDPLTAMKSTAFEIEYSLGEYQLMSYPLPKANVLAITHHLKKIIVYDLNKWDGDVCRFYEVMRHEIQHVRNFRMRSSCNQRHHFVKGNHDERSTYLNDLVFISKYCPENKALYRNVEAMLLRMYQDKNLQTCGVGPDAGEGEGADQDSKSPSDSKGGDSTKTRIEKILQDYKKNPSKYKVIRYSGKPHRHRGGSFSRPQIPKPYNPNDLH